MSAPEVSVVIPTRNRPAELARCLAAVLAQKTARPFEVVVANDGKGRGPAAARNAGLGATTAPVVLFTDDDTVPEPGWLEAAAAALEDDPAAVGVEGPTETPAYDPLYARSVQNTEAGAYFTCNVGYRRDALLEEGGFDEGFAHAHGEDVDLGRRMRARGPILFAPAMRVTHLPSPFGLRDAARRGRLVESDWRLWRKHPELAPSRWPRRWAPLFGAIRRWHRVAKTDTSVRRSPRRAARLALLAFAQSSSALTWTLRRWGALR